MEKKHKKPFQKLKIYFKMHPKKAWIITTIIFIAIAFITSAAIAFMKTENTSAPKNTTQKTTKKVEVKEEEKFYSPLTGVQVASKDKVVKPVNAVMIENSPAARPQSGLKKAEVVYEAIAEGGITRFLALYQQEKPSLVGPVRSLRDYYIDWVSSYDATVFHVGGSTKALSRIRNGNYKDADEMLNSSVFWRSQDRYAPHNVYTNFENIDKFNESKKYITSGAKPFSRTDTPISGQAANNINVQISSQTYNSNYSYDANSKTYLRTMAGQPHIDREDGQISPSVVVVLKAEMHTVNEDGYRESIATIGNGEATIFQNGTVNVVNWSKNSAEEQIRFTDSEGKDFPLARGQTWITVIPISGGAVSWQ